MKRQWKVYLPAAVALLLVACSGTKTCVIPTGNPNSQVLYAYQDGAGNTVQGMADTDAEGNVTITGVPDHVDCGSTDYRQISPEYGSV